LKPNLLTYDGSKVCDCFIIRRPSQARAYTSATFTPYCLIITYLTEAGKQSATWPHKSILHAEDYVMMLLTPMQQRPSNV